MEHGWTQILIHNSLTVVSGINEVDCFENLMIGYESKIDIFKEMRYFLKFYLNFYSMV